MFLYLCVCIKSYFVKKCWSVDVTESLVHVIVSSVPVSPKQADFDVSLSA